MFKTIQSYLIVLIIAIIAFYPYATKSKKASAIAEEEKEILYISEITSKDFEVITNYIPARYEVVTNEREKKVETIEISKWVKYTNEKYKILSRTNGDLRHDTSLDIDAIMLRTKYRFTSWNFEPGDDHYFKSFTSNYKEGETFPGPLTTSVCAGEAL